MKINVTRLPALRAAKLQEINEGFEAACAALTEGYPGTEKLTWPTQHAEAIAWGADPTAPTPYLDGLAVARNIDPLDLREKTLYKVQLFLQASQFLVGTRQWLEDKINVASAAELEQIHWPSAEELARMREALAS